jgi:acetyl-CoA carboxylase biotin carboxylase subunit
LFKKVLSANRGEIAVRILRACRELDIQAVVAYSEADRDSLPVLLADEAVCVGPARAYDSYLNVSRIVAAAQTTNCDAVHPGYGFLSESPEFVDALESCGAVFVGPRAETMRLLGDKIAARAAMTAAGVPVTPGSDGEVRELAEAEKVCAALGYPVLVKAAAGGGGKGMRVIRRDKDLEAGFRMCRAEAKASFDDARVYIEKYVTGSRHIEVQILADSSGTVAHLGERDCSCQRRHQKLVEETPAPNLDALSRARLTGWAVAAARAAGYVNAGTVEFICDEAGNCYFMEMNVRLQVEHAITEMVTGVDIVCEQLRIAALEPLGPEIAAASERGPDGHAIECRIYAEDPDADFVPSPGLVTRLHLPGGPGVRVDSHLETWYRVHASYDPLIAKVCAWAPDRDAAMARMDRALAETVIAGVTTTAPFLRRVIRDGRFRRGRMSTNTLDENF